MSPYVGRRATYETQRRITEFSDALSLGQGIESAAHQYLAATINKFSRVDYNAYALALIFYALRESGDEVRMDDFRRMCDSSKKIFRFRNRAKRVTFYKELRRWYARLAAVLGTQPQSTDMKIQFELAGITRRIKVDKDTLALTEEICSGYSAGHIVANVPVMVGGALAFALKKNGCEYPLKQIASELNLNYSMLTYYFRRIAKDVPP